MLQEEDVDVPIKLTSGNPQKLINVKRFDFNKQEFTPVRIRPHELSYVIMSTMHVYFFLCAVGRP